MKKREFATYIFKIFSIIIFVSAVSDLPIRLSAYYPNHLTNVFVTVCLMALLTVMLWLLASWLSELIVVEDGDLNSRFQMSALDVTMCAITLLGMYLIAYGIIDFLSYLTKFFQVRNSVRGDAEFEASRFTPGLICNAFKAILGALLISKAKPIASFVRKHQDK